MTASIYAALLGSALAFGASVRIAAHLEDSKVTESSGVAASRLTPGLYWTHNDSGDGPILYAFGPDGRSRGRWRVPNARAVDWEDIAAGPGPTRGRSYLYIGDIGDNERRRKEIVVYRVEEPGVAACKAACRTAPAATIRLRYPDGPHNAEALLIHPRTGDLYIVSKAGPGDPETRVYKARPLTGRPVTLARIATLDVPGPLFTAFVGGITGGDISPDGTGVVLCDYFHAYEARLPAGAAFDQIWRRPFRAISIGVGLQVEGICYRTDGRGMVATSEGKPCPVIEIAP